MTNPSLLRRLVAALAVVAALPVAGALAHDGGNVDAGANATMQPITVTVSLDADAHATPRVWNFVVQDDNGTIVDSLTVSTTREAPVASVATQPIANGDYVVRLLPSHHVAPACYTGIFYEIVSPAGGASTVTLDGAPAAVHYTFAPCPDNPAELGVDYSSGPGAGSAAPAARGTGVSFDTTPAPPATGTGLAAARTGSAWPAALAGAFLVTGAALAAAASLTRNRGQ